jgi:hypothetical protein
MFEGAWTNNLFRNRQFCQYFPGNRADARRVPGVFPAGRITDNNTICQLFIPGTRKNKEIVMKFTGKSASKMIFQGSGLSHDYD